MNGDQSNNWGGFVQLKNQVGNISSLLTSASTSISTHFTGDSWLVDDMIAMNKANLNIYKNNKDAVLVTPNKDTSATARTNGDPLPTVNSVFIQTGLGPNGTTDTMVNDIDISLRVT
eukprot:GHVR01169532.1.p1 GENE.GHVR01169532.1~~GHVR01169532.1.p1  ORF type:complete len:117 (-),score=28.61 GHVR01169532.1:1128-1478(-)